MDKMTPNELVENLENIRENPEILTALKFGLAVVELKYEKESNPNFGPFVRTLENYGYKIDKVDELTALVDASKNTFVIPYLGHPRTMALVGLMAESVNHLNTPPSKYQFDDIVWAYVGLFRRSQIF